MMKRSAQGPNVVSQTIRRLAPGRLYSLKLLGSDYGDLVGGQSREQQNALSIGIGNVEVVDEPSKSFEFTYPHSYGRTLGAFTPQHQYGVNYHRRIFRARGPSARSR